MLRTVDVNGRVPKPALKPYPNFNADHDAEVLKKAMDGLGTDEAMVVEILGHRTSSQRLQIASRYKALYGKDLRENLDSELSGDFGELVDLLFFTPVELKAEICYKAIRGLGTDEDALIEVICTATTAELQQLKQEYAKVLQKHGKVGSIDSLEEHIKSDTSGYFRRILLALLAAQRPEPTEDQIQTMLNKGVDTFIDRKAARADAEALYNAGEKKLGTDEATFINILCNRNPWQLMAISKAYEEISKLRLVEAIASETSGDFKHALITTLTAQISRPMAFAELLNRAIAGLGTNDDELMRIVVWRSEIDMEDIKNAYLTRYNESLEEAIKDDTSGDYEKLLLALIGC